MNKYKSCLMYVARFFVLFNIFFCVTFSVEAKESLDNSDDLQVRQFAEMVINKNDNKERPFIIVDKRQARLYVFDSNGILLSDAPALLGMAVGDVLSPEIARRPLAQITPSNRITPAGRYIGELGRDTHGKAVLWVDFNGNLAIHPVINVPKQHRLERLTSKTIEDNRISWGCINVPQVFFKTIIEKNFMTTKGMVYILPEMSLIEDYFWFEKADKKIEVKL